MFCQDTTTSWSYNVATIRAADANTTDGVGRVSFCSWFPSVPIETTCYCSVQVPASGITSIGIGVDSTTTMSAGAFVGLHLVPQLWIVP